jgi:hypothetical protein
MLAALPVLALAGLVLLLATLHPAWGWRRSFLRAAVLTAAAAVLLTEGLSLIGAVSTGALGLAWGLLLVGEVGWLVAGFLRGRHLQFPEFRLPSGWIDRVLALAIVLIVLVLALIAFYAPPNTWDSLNYHMARVAHWAQLRAIRPYATGIEVQNGIGPGAETLVLQLYVLAGGDRWVNFVQWFAMVVCLLGASRLAGRLGANPLGQLLAALLVATLPMGIAEASSTMTDYVLAAWMMAVASETLDLVLEAADRSPVVFLSLSGGLALTVKPTAFAYLLPFAVWAGVAILRRSSRTRASAIGMALAAVLLLNAGQWTRNMLVFGNPIGTTDLAEVHSNEIHTPAALISNLTRHAGMHAFTPWPAVNDVLWRGILKIHQWIGLGVGDPRTTSVGEFVPRTPGTGETISTNWYHAWLYLVAIILLMLGRRRFARPVLGMAMAVLATFVVFCFVFKWQVFSSRYHLPFFVLFAPVAARAVSGWLPAWGARALGVVFLIACWPWLTGIDQRPLLPKARTSVSVLNTPRDQLYAWPGSVGAMDEVSALIRAEGCSSVGILLSGGAAEYPFWVFLGAPRSDLRIEWIVSGTPSARFEDPHFRPCAVICDASCPQEWTGIRGLNRLVEMGGYRLFLR